MPGRKATLATCSGARSLRRCGRRRSSANTRPSTRIPALYDRGIR